MNGVDTTFIKQRSRREGKSGALYNARWCQYKHLLTFALIEIKLEPRQAFDTDFGISIWEKEWLHHGSQGLDSNQAELTGQILL